MYFFVSINVAICLLIEDESVSFPIIRTVHN